jgi:hypothetical protein
MAQQHSNLSASYSAENYQMTKNTFRYTPRLDRIGYCPAIYSMQNQNIRELNGISSGAKRRSLNTGSPEPVTQE